MAKCRCFQHPPVSVWPAQPWLRRLCGAGVFRRGIAGDVGAFVVVLIGDCGANWLAHKNPDSPEPAGFSSSPTAVCFMLSLHSVTRDQHLICVPISQLSGLDWPSRQSVEHADSGWSFALLDTSAPRIHGTSCHPRSSVARREQDQHRAFCLRTRSGALFKRHLNRATPRCAGELPSVFRILSEPS